MSAQIALPDSEPAGTGQERRELDGVVIRFAGDSGDGMQMTGDRHLGERATRQRSFDPSGLPRRDPRSRRHARRGLGLSDPLLRSAARAEGLNLKARRLNLSAPPHRHRGVHLVPFRVQSGALSGTTTTSKIHSDQRRCAKRLVARSLGNALTTQSGRTRVQGRSASSLVKASLVCP